MSETKFQPGVNRCNSTEIKGILPQRFFRAFHRCKLNDLSGSTLQMFCNENRIGMKLHYYGKAFDTVTIQLPSDGINARHCPN